MLLLINIVVLVTLFIILIAVASRNDFWTRMIGEIYNGAGIALAAGSVVGYFLVEDFSQFLTFFILGIVAIIIGIVLVLTSEAIIIKSQEFN